MITITDKHNCCGCEACRQRCPHDCITMREDNEGFLYPEVDMAKCIDCGLCEKVCPIINVPSDVREPLHTYAAINPNEEIRMASSSGGIFSALAEQTLTTGGVVFGARFDKDWNVEHGWTDTLDGIKAFRGSKYVQSKIGNSYREVERFLKQGRNVLFSGTPCQIAGLKTFLRKDYPNLLTVDIICHGVPSPKAWQSYLHRKKTNAPEIVDFRDKTTGWETYSICIKNNKRTFRERATNNNYMRCFIGNLTLRPSCYNCCFKKAQSSSDISIGDFWGLRHIHPNLADNKGVSVVIVNSNKGNHQLSNINVIIENSQYNLAVNYNPAIVTSSSVDEHMRESFWNDFTTYGSKAIEQYGKKFAPNLLLRLKIAIARILKK